MENVRNAVKGTNGYELHNSKGLGALPIGGYGPQKIGSTRGKFKDVVSSALKEWPDM